MNGPLSSLPQSWSDLSWQQLCDAWNAKMRYGGNADMARAAALLALVRCSVCHETGTAVSDTTGETVYTLQDEDGRMYNVTPRELSQMAWQALRWVDYPYGDPGEPEEKDESGRVVKEARKPHHGYVSPMRDAMILPETEVTVGGVAFALPTVACANITWQQYRTLQNIVPQLFQEGIAESQVLELQAQFLSHCLVPAQDAHESMGGDRFRPTHSFRYDSDRAEQSIPFWRVQQAACPTLFHICFQTYQTAIGYYAQVFPLLFNGGGKKDALHDALTGETETLNSVMKYQGYSSPEEVYAADLPNILTVLNTMTKEAKEIEKMNAKIKKK